jgi:hypothetical protein
MMSDVYVVKTRTMAEQVMAAWDNDAGIVQRVAKRTGVVP